MSRVFVQFSDASKAAVVAVFGCRQSDVEYPHQEEIDDRDERYLAFVDPLSVRSVAIAHKWGAIKAERDRRMLQGGYKVGAKWFHSDQFSRSQQIGLFLLGDNIPADVQWKTMDGSFIPMSAQSATQIIEAAAASDQAIFEAAEVHRAAMELSDDPITYNFTSGWPPIYGE